VQIKEIMSMNPKSVSPLATLQKAAKIMKNENIGSLPVCNERGETVGIVTDRDIVMRAIANDQDCQFACVNEVMSTDIISANANMSVLEASKLMGEKQIRRLPVLDQQRLVGMVSLGDFALHYQTDEQAKDALSEISEPGIH